MCLYHYLYFSVCQHGELTLITYCDKAKALGLADRDNLDIVSESGSTSLSSPSANHSNASHSHNQQHQHNMATLSPSKPRYKPGCGPTPVHHDRSPPQRVAFVPRSALPELGSQGPVAISPSSVSLSVVHAMQAFNTNDAGDGALLLSAEHPRQGLQRNDVFVTDSAARDDRDSDEEISQDSSEASIDIITERDTGAYSDVRSASPRKPLPQQWLHPLDSPPSRKDQRDEAPRDTQAFLSDPPGARRAAWATRSSFGVGKAHVDATSFLTKEALDAVDSNIASPTLRRSPSKIQRSPTKVPWNSPTVSPKIGTLRRSGTSPTKPSSPRGAHLAHERTGDHRRSPSSIVSTGATSFHTAHGSPVRSAACSQSSFSSAEDLDDSVYYHCSDFVADVDVEQVTDFGSKAMASSMTAPKALLRSRTSRPELSIRIPPWSSTLDVGPKSPTTLASSTSSTAMSAGGGSSPALDHLEGQYGFSRIPRMSVSKGSSARGPTLSSTLKQTKSTQNLRSPTATKGKTSSKSPTVPKATGTKSLRRVRAVNIVGTTTISHNRPIGDCSISATLADVAMTKTEHVSSASKSDLLTSCLRDTTLQTPEVVEEFPASSTTSRATSSSTVKALQIVDDSQSSGSAGERTLKDLDSSGNIHSSDADDEYDDSSPDRGRSAQYSPNNCRTTISEVSMQSSSASDLRPTATEFVPTLKDSSGNFTADEPSLPDMYALDGYGIPWFYHMYPVPWMLPPMYPRVRSKSPKKLRPKKQRSAVTSAATDHAIRLAGIDSGPTHQTPKVASDKIKAFDSPFSIQLDVIAHQTALQTGTNTVQAPQVDLTTIRNVPVSEYSPRTHPNDYGTVPSRPRNQRQIGNGLYGGRGNVGVPLYETAPFPMPIPPMGRPIEQIGVGSTGYAIGAQGCGTLEVEVAAEYGGGQACNTCEPDH